MSAASHAAQALIAFLKCEANSSEERAKSLRTTAASIEANALSYEAERRRKRRKLSPKPKEKKAHTGYTLYIHENYEVIRQQDANSELSSKDINAIIARQWLEADEQEKQAWQFKADQLKQAAATAAAAGAAIAPEVQDMELPAEATALEDWLLSPGATATTATAAGAAAAAASPGNRKRKAPPKHTYV